MNKKFKSFLSVFMSAAIAVSSVSVTASADDSEYVQTVADVSDAIYVETDIAEPEQDADDMIVVDVEDITTPVLIESMPVVELSDAAVEAVEKGAASGTSNGCSWAVSDAGVLTITGSGNMTDFSDSSSASLSEWYDYMAMVTEISISGVSHIGDYSFHGFTKVRKITINDVESIGNYAFYGCTALETLTLDADSVTSIGDYAFYNCSPLKSLTIPAGVTNIGTYAFNGCKYIEEVTIPAGVGANFGAAAFYGCSSLVEVNIAEGVSAINDNTFSGCTALETVTLPSTLTVIGAGAFNNCTALSEVNGDSDCLEIPAKVTSIGANAFTNCSALKSVLITGGVELIGKQAFMTCTELTGIRIEGKQTTTIGEEAFASCGKLLAVTLDNGNVTTIDKKAFYQSGVQNIKFSDTLMSIGESAFQETHITSVALPASVTTVGKQAFYDITELTALTVSNTGRISALTLGVSAFENDTALATVSLEGVGTFSASAFKGCTSLKAVEVPSTTVNMNKDVFANCTSLTKFTIADGATYLGATVIAGCPVTEVVIPSSVTTTTSAFVGHADLEKVTANGKSINNYTFQKCAKLSDVTLNNTLLVGSNAFEGCTALEEINLPVSLTSLGASAFKGCTALTSLDIPANITTIPASVCAGCTALTKATYGNVTAINANAFDGCNALESALIPSTVQTIGNYAFRGCIAIPSVVTHDGTTKSIGTGAFYGCTSLATVTLGDAINTINASAFENCITLKSIQLPEVLTILNDKVFMGCSALSTVTGGTQLTKIGSNTFNGCMPLSGYTIPSTVTTIGANAFENCVLFDSAIPSGVISIGKAAFKNCASLGKTAVIIIPTQEKLTKIDAEVFYGCKSLPNIAIPSNITSIGDGAFQGCNSKDFTRVSLTANIQTIGKSAYQDCKNLTNVTITSGDKSCTTLGASCFEGCTALRSITLPTTVTTVNQACFRNCTSLESITLPQTVKTLGADTFSGCTALAKATIASTAITVINANLFLNCSALESIDIPATATAINASAFQGCTSLSSVTIPGKVTAIQQNAFQDCTSLEFVVLPVALKTFGKSAFGGCTALESVIFLSMSSPASNTEFFVDYGDLTIYCYEGSAIAKSFCEPNNIECSYLTGSDGSYVVVLKQPRTTTDISIGDQIKLTVKVASEGTISYQWFYKNPGDAEYTKAEGFTGDSYTMTVTSATDGQRVYCAVTSVSASDETVTNEVASNVAVISTIKTPVAEVAARAPEAIKITWSTDSKATGYKVYRADELRGEKKLIGDVTANSFTDTAVVVGSTYYYFVTATIKDLELETNYSAAVEVKVPSPMTAPTNVKAVAGEGQVTLTWDAVTGAEEYNVFTYLNGKYALVATVTKPMCIVTGLTGGTKYGFLVRAGAEGVWSSFTTADIVYATPTAPKKPVVTATAGEGKVTLTWAAVSGATNYKVFTYLNNKYTELGTTTSTSYVATGLTAGTKYGFLVRSYVGTAWTTFTTADVVYATPTAPAKPVVTATAGQCQVALKWNAVTGATKYNVYSYLNGKYALLTTTTSTSYVATGLTAGTKYGFVVRAYVGTAWTAFTDADIVYATPTGALKPVVTATAGEGKVTLSWKAVSGATNYNVYSYLNGKYTLLTTTTSTSYVATGLTAGTKYGFVVRALVNGAWTAFTDADRVYATPTGALKPIVTVTAGDDCATLTWNAVAGATNYRVFYYLNGYKVAGETTATSYKVTGLTGGTKYGFLVRALVNGAWTAFSDADLEYATPV